MLASASWQKPVIARSWCRRSSSHGSKRCVVARIAVGEQIPDAVLSYFDPNGDFVEITTAQLCRGRKIVLFAVPGAFLPTCSMKHLPGYMNLADQMAELGVDRIACVSVNDAFVMDAWSKSLGAGKILMLADGNAAFATAMGAQLDLTSKGVGIRSRRYSLIAEDGIVTHTHMEDGSAFTVSNAERILDDLLKQRGVEQAAVTSDGVGMQATA